MADRTGQQFGSYRLLRRLGGGGFAEVYLGQHLRVSTQQAAIKILQLTDVDEQQFQQEAERTAALKHAHIIRLYDFDIQQGVPFLVLEYALQGSLARHQGQRLSLDTILSYITQIAPALQYAHDNEVIHRDIKPDNILVGSQGELLVSDFGIAVISKTGRTTVQATYNTGGTPYYMAPEMFRGRPEKASDQYSLGIMVYEWLCGRRPFIEGDFIQLGYQHAYEPVPSIHELVPSIPQAIEKVVKKALAKDPLQRYKNVATFATALEQAIMLPKTEVAPLSLYTQETGNKLPHVIVPSTPQAQEKGSNLPPPIVVPSTPQTQERASPLPPKELVPPKSVEQPQSDKRTISRRSTLIGLGVIGLVVVGGSTAWLALSQKPPSGTTAITRNSSTSKTTSPLLYTYTDHSGGVGAIAWSPDSKHIAYVSNNSTKVWDTFTGHIPLTFPGNAISWSPSGKYIATGPGPNGLDEAVEIWDASTGKITNMYIDSNASGVSEIGWSPNNKYIAFSYNQAVEVRNAFTGQKYVTYTAHSDIVTEFAWSPDSKYIASSSYDQTVKVWDVSTGHTTVTFIGHLDKVLTVAWSPNGKYIASGSADLQVWNASTGKWSFTYSEHSGDVYAITWSPDSKYIASGSSDSTIKICNASNGQTLVTFTGHSSAVNAVAWSPDGKYIASSSDDSTLKLWNAL